MGIVARRPAWWQAELPQQEDESARCIRLRNGANTRRRGSLSRSNSGDLATRRGPVPAGINPPARPGEGGVPNQGGSRPPLAATISFSRTEPFQCPPTRRAATAGRCAAAPAPFGPTTFPSPEPTSATSAARTAACRSNGPIGWTSPSRLRFLEDAHAAGHRNPRPHGRRTVPVSRVRAGDVPPGRGAGLSLRQDHVQRRLAFGRRPPGGGADGAGGRRLQRQAGPERGQVPRRPHGQGGGVLSRRPGASSAATTSCRCLTPAVGPTWAWNRCTSWPASWTRWSNGRTCCIVICWCRRS